MSDVLQIPILQFKGNSYKLKEPTAGSLLDIEVMKSVLTKGKYGEIVKHGTVIANWNLDNVDMFAHLMVLCPDMVERDFKATDWREMAIVDINSLKDEYQKKFVPWFENRLSFLNPTHKEEEKKSEE